MDAKMPAIGVRFDVDKIESGYGEHCWKVFWDAIEPLRLTGALVYEGDTAATLVRKENVFCIAIQSTDRRIAGKVEKALSKSDEFRKVRARQMFVEGDKCMSEPLPLAGRIDVDGRLVLDAGASASARVVTQKPTDQPERASSEPSCPPEDATIARSSKQEATGVCDTCGVAGVSASEGGCVFAASQMRKATSRGFEALAGKGPIVEYCRRMGIDPETVNRDFRQRVSADPSDWLLCPDCCIRFEHCLRQRGKTSGKAIAALVLGLVSFAFCLASIPAIIVAFLAMSDMRESQGQLRGRGLAIAALVLGVLGPVVLVACLLRVVNAPYIGPDYTPEIARRFGQDPATLKNLIQSLADEDVQNLVLRELQAKDMDGLYLHPQIPPEMLESSRSSCMIPDDEKVLGVLDATILGSAEDALVFGQRGVYYHNSCGKQLGPGGCLYCRFPFTRFSTAGMCEIAMGGHCYFQRSACDASSKEIIDLLSRISRALLDAVPSQGDDSVEQEAAASSPTDKDPNSAQETLNTSERAPTVTDDNPIFDRKASDVPWTVTTEPESEGVDVEALGEDSGEPNSSQMEPEVPSAEAESSPAKVIQPTEMPGKPLVLDGGELVCPLGRLANVQLPSRVEVITRTPFQSFQIQGVEVEPSSEVITADNNTLLVWLVFEAGDTMGKHVSADRNEYIINMNGKEHVCKAVEHNKGPDSALNLKMGTPVLSGELGFRRLLFVLPGNTSGFTFIYRPEEGDELSVRAQIPGRENLSRPQNYRTWTNPTGEFKVEAMLLGLEDGKVQLKRKDGPVIKIPVTALCETDRELIASVLDAAASSPAEASHEEISPQEALSRLRTATDANLGQYLKMLPELESLTLGRGVSDVGMVHLKGLAKLEYLTFCLTQVSDVGLVHLSGLTQLKDLNLFMSRVGDGGMVHLGQLTTLERLNLSSTQVGDTGLVHLRGLTRLKDLNLSKTRVSDGGMVHLGQLATLECLTLNNTQVGDTGLGSLSGLTKLRSLWLGETQVTDAGLEHLKKLTSLQVIYLYGTQVTDAGLEHLSEMTNLKSLILSQTQVSDEGVKKLKIALPKCSIRAVIKDQ